MSTRPIVVWFRQDLRLTDNVALSKAVASGNPVIALFVLDESTAGDWVLGGASKWWLHHSLESLAKDLSELGSKLILRRGRHASTVPDFVREVAAQGLYFSRQYEPWAASDEAAIQAELQSADGGDVDVRRFSGSLLKEPEDIRTKQGGLTRSTRRFGGRSTNMARRETRFHGPRQYRPSNRI
jgi:deoxyribodipyrimidine photo-lyase